jgi:hypothetical protein
MMDGCGVTPNTPRGAVFLTSLTVVFDSRVVGVDKDVKHVTRATKTRIEYGGETG